VILAWRPSKSFRSSETVSKRRSVPLAIRGRGTSGKSLLQVSHRVARVAAIVPRAHRGREGESGFRRASRRDALVGAGLRRRVDRPLVDGGGARASRSRNPFGRPIGSFLEIGDEAFQVCRPRLAIIKLREVVCKGKGDVWVGNKTMDGVAKR